MLSCRELAHHLASDYTDGTLGWRQRLAVRMHLFICEDCRRFIRQLKLVRAVVLRRTQPPTTAETGKKEDPFAAVNEHQLLNLAERLHAQYGHQSPNQDQQNRE